jgi:hypothetical protein
MFVDYDRRFSKWYEANGAISEPKQILFDTSEQAIVRANSFSHRYENAKQNLEADAPQANRRIDNGSILRAPFPWVKYDDQLNLDLYNLPALGGTASSRTTNPPASTTLSRVDLTRGRWSVNFRNAITQTWRNPSQVEIFPRTPVVASLTPDGTWQLETISKDRAADGYNAVRISDGNPGTMNVVTMMTSAAFPNGYYPSCSDLMEVTAQVTTPLPAAALIDPADPFAPENMCGPFTIRFYLDPKPQVEITQRKQSEPVLDNFSLELDVRLNIPNMIGVTTGSTFVWQRQILTAATGYNATTPPWVNITSGVLADNLHMTGRFTESSLNQGDSIRVRCVMTFPSIAINSIIDNNCRTMTSSIIPIPSTISENNTLLAIALLGNDILTSNLSKFALDERQITSSVGDSLNRKLQPVAGKRASAQAAASYTVDLLTAPNPAQAQVGLRFTLPGKATTTVEIIDALQRVALTPLNAVPLQEGEQNVAVPVGSLTTGAYFVRLRAVLANGVVLTNQRSLIIAR